MNRILFFLIAALAVCTLQAQTFDLKGEFRVRPEFRNGYKQLPDSSSETAFFVAQRNRISMHYAADLYEMQFTLQEGRVWGDQLFKSDKSTIGIFEAWVSMKLTDSLRLKMGRQKLSFGNQRLLADNNWSRTGQVHDAAMLCWKSGNNSLNVGLAFNQRTENTFGTDYINSAAEIKDNYKTMSFLRAGHKFGNLDVTAMALADGFQDLNSSALYVRSTEGVEVKYIKNKLSLFGSGYYQNGTKSNGQDIAAWYANIEAEYKTDKWSALLGSELMSGDDVTSDSYNQFIPLYGSNHTFNGYIDYFTNMATNTGGAGLMDSYLKLSYNVNKVHSCMLDYHYFATQQTTLTGGANIDQFLAHEIDLTWKMKLAKDLNVTMGYSLLLGSPTLELITARSESKLAHWTYICLEFKPTFLQHKFEDKK